MKEFWPPTHIVDSHEPCQLLQVKRTEGQMTLQSPN